jgi:hypothetical protein
VFANRSLVRILGFSLATSLTLPRLIHAAVVKAVAGKEMVIDGLMVVRKSGGKSGNWQRTLGSNTTS